MSKPVPKPNIVQVFEYYDLKVIGADTGGWRKASCPIPEHEDANPSATVNEDLCRWRCHACSEGGDALDVIMRREDVGWSRAVAIAQSLVDGGDGAVRASSDRRQSSGLLPGRERRNGRRSAYVPPWLR